MEVEIRIAKQYKCQYCCSCKNYREKEMEGEQKVSLRRFGANQKIASSWGGKAVWGILLHEQQVIACFQTHSDYGPPEMPLKLAV